MRSAPQLFHARVSHLRLRPARHRFWYPLFFVRLPLRTLERANCALFSVDRPNLFSFYQRDHGPRDGSALLAWIEARLRERGLAHDGEIVLQAFPRVFGRVFNPVSFWFCHDGGGRLVAVLAEVNNTFGDHHAYLLHNDDGSPLRDGQLLYARKCLHVSPFNRIEGRYRFRFLLERARPRIRIGYDDARGPLLLAALAARPAGWGSRALLGALLRMPLPGGGVLLRIYWQALKLWAKRVPFLGAHPHHPDPGSQ